MKILAMVSVAQSAQIETIRAELAKEVRGSWDLFASGVVREAYAIPPRRAGSCSCSRPTTSQMRRSTCAGSRSLLPGYFEWTWSNFAPSLIGRCYLPTEGELPASATVPIPANQSTTSALTESLGGIADSLCSLRVL